jgi:hypothetical protein
MKTLLSSVALTLVPALSLAQTQQELEVFKNDLSFEIQKANKELIAAINDAAFRVELDSTGRPLRKPSDFYVFRGSDPTTYTGAWAEAFADEVRAARKAKAYQVAWDRYNARIEAMKARPVGPSEEKAIDGALSSKLQASKELARKLYPQIRDKDSLLSKRWSKIYESLDEDDPLRTDPDAPLIITIRAANTLGLSPESSNSKDDR